MHTNRFEQVVQTAVFILLPLLLSLLWLPILPERAHEAASAARGLLLGETQQLGNTSPLWLALMVLLTPSIAAMLSAFLWGMSGVLLSQTLRQTTPNRAANWLPLLLLASPLLPISLGTAVPAQLLLVIVLLLTTVTKRWQWQKWLLLLLPFVWLDWLALPFVAGLLGWRHHKEQSQGWSDLILVSGAFGVAGGLNWLVWERLPSLPNLDLLLGAALFVCGGLFLLAAVVINLYDQLKPRLSQLAPIQAQAWLTALIALPLLLLASQWLWEQYQLRPVAHDDLLFEAAAWLATNDESETAVLAPAAFTTYRSRPHWVFPVAETPAEWQPWLVTMLAETPPIIVTSNTLNWNQLIQTGWFQERYRPMQQFGSQASALSPVTIWQYESSSFDAGDVEEMSVSADNGLQLISHQTWPRRIEPGEALYVTLNWQTAVPLTDNINSIVRVIAPIDQVGWAQRNLRTPRSLPPEWITPSETIFPERFVLTTTTDIPAGAYQINLSLMTGRDETFTPVYQNNDANPLDRILLGYLSVPWPGEVPDEAVSVNGRYGEQILLNSYHLSGTPQPGETMTVSLFWTAIRPPDADFTIFVHLLDEAGNFVLGDDRIPLDGRYPTRGLLPDAPTPSTHFLTLPPDLPSGTYQILVGIYLPETGERLTALNAAGESAPNQSLLLQTIELQP